MEVSEAQRIYRENAPIFIIHLVSLPKKMNQLLYHLEVGPRESLLKPSFLFPGNQGIWPNALKELLLLCRVSYEEPLVQPFSNFSGPAVLFLGILWTCGCWFSRPGWGFEFLHVSHLLGDANYAGWWRGGITLYSQSPKTLNKQRN